MSLKSFLLWIRVPLLERSITFQLASIRVRIRFPEIVLTVWLSHKKNFVHDIFCPKDVWWIGSIPYEHVPDILSTHHFIVREHNRNLKCQKKQKLVQVHFWLFQFSPLVLHLIVVHNLRKKTWKILSEAN